MLLIPISPLIAACAAHSGALKILLIAVFSAFCNLSISSPFVTITSAQYRALGSTTPFQYVFPILSNMFSPLFSPSMATFFDDKVCHHAQYFDFFSSFRSFVLQTHFSLLVLSLLSILVLLLLLYYIFFRIFPSC